MSRTILIASATIIAAIVSFVVMHDGALPPSDDPTPDATPTAVITTTSPTPTASPTHTPSPTPEPTPSPTPEPATPAARYQTAIAARDNGAIADAQEHFQHLIDEAGPLAPFARLRLAQALLAAGEYNEAATAFDLALADPDLPEIFHPLALIEGAAALAADSRSSEAIAWLTVARNHPGASSNERTIATWDRALVRLDLEDPLWIADALAILSTAPASPQATAALIALDESAPEDIPPLAAAYSQYRARENQDAIDRYEPIRDEAIKLEDNHTAGIATFYLGALAERTTGRLDAIQHYSHSLELDPTGSFADDAAYWRGRVAEERADFDLAAESYNLLIDSYPSSRFLTDATLRAALTTYLAGDEATGLALLAAIAQSNGPSDAAAARWYDLLAGSDAREAAGIAAPAGLDARALGAVLATRSPHSEGDLPTAAEDFEVIAGWLLTHFDADLEATQATTTETPLWTTTIPALLEAGERSLARALSTHALDQISGRDASEIAIALRARELQLHDVALIATLRVIGSWSTEQRLANPAAVERLAYPSPWTTELQLATAEFGIPPLILLALVRQESAFNPEAVSPAAAVGLTQVIPDTGALIAASLDQPWEGIQSLTDPAESLRFGSAYLATQLETFDGDIYATLAGYNGGPWSAERWLDEQQLPGADGFVQVIDFEETRRYVTTVIEQFAWYRYVYGLAETPSLP